MGIDFSKVNEAVKRQAEREANRDSFEKVRFWKARVGENVIRVVPPWTDEGPNANVFWREIEQHWNVGEGGYDEANGWTITCARKTFDLDTEECSICDVIDRLKATGSDIDKKSAKEIRAKPRSLINIVDLKDPVFTDSDLEDWQEAHEEGAECPWAVGDTKVVVWAAPGGCLKEILDICNDGLDITSLEAGRDIVVTRTGKGKTKTKYRIRSKPVDSAFDAIGDLDTIMYNLDKVSNPHQDEFIQKLLSGERGDNALPNSEAPRLPQAEASTVTRAVEPKPECFGDVEVHSTSDPVCVGGAADDGNEYEACSHFGTCAQAVAALKKPAPARRRRPAPKASATDLTSQAVLDVERQLREALDG